MTIGQSSTYGLPVFSAEENGKVFLRISSTYVVSMIMVFLGEDNCKVFLRNFLEHTKKILRPADVTLFLSGHAVLLIIMWQN